jgi:hypothetical protein
MKGVRIGRSSISGRGLFATKAFERGDRICEYTGRLYRGDTYPDNRYLFEINDLWTLDGSPKSNIGRWAMPERLKRGPVTFHLRAQLSAAGDSTKDPTVPWPHDRKLVELGVLTIDKAVPNSAEVEKKLLFLPG